MRKDEGQTQQQISRQFLDREHQTGEHCFMEADSEDVTTDRQNLALMQSDADESSFEPSLTSNHSAYINVSGSDDDSRHPTTDKGLCHFLAFLNKATMYHILLSGSVWY